MHSAINNSNLTVHRKT